MLKENLQAALERNNHHIEVAVDVNHGDMQLLKHEGVDLFLIPEDIAGYVDYKGINMAACFKLSHDEYENGHIERVLEYIEKRNGDGSL